MVAAEVVVELLHCLAGCGTIGVSWGWGVGGGGEGGGGGGCALTARHMEACWVPL